MNSRKGVFCSKLLLRVFIIFIIILLELALCVVKAEMNICDTVTTSFYIARRFSV